MAYKAAYSSNFGTVFCIMGAIRHYKTNFNTILTLGS